MCGRTTRAVHTPAHSPPLPFDSQAGAQHTTERREGATWYSGKATLFLASISLNVELDRGGPHPGQQWTAGHPHHGAPV